MLNNMIIKNFLTGRNKLLLSTSLLLLRCAIGIILFIVGSGKLFGWFGGIGMEQTIKGFAQAGISLPLTYLSTYTEFIGGILLSIGLFTRPVAIAISINMAVATVITLPGGFLGPTGAVLPFIFLVGTIVILLSGPLTFSVDRILFNNETGNNT